MVHVINRIPSRNFKLMFEVSTHQFQVRDSLCIIPQELYHVHSVMIQTIVVVHVEGTDIQDKTKRSQSRKSCKESGRKKSRSCLYARLPIKRFKLAPERCKKISKLEVCLKRAQNDHLKLDASFHVCLSPKLSSENSITDM